MRIVEGQRGGIESRGGRERPSPSTRRRRGGAGLGGGGGNRWSGGGGGAGDGTECFGWVGWLPPAVSTEQSLCLRNAVLGQDWKVVGWTVEFVRGGRMDDGRVVLITCQPRLGRLLASQTTPSCYFLFLFLFLTFFIAAFSSQY
jgi:hypothetical protein